jgi:hypothetical protein
MASNEDEEAQGFIVSDGHLSVSEYNFSQGDLDDDAKMQEIENRRARLKS